VLMQLFSFRATSAAGLIVLTDTAGEVIQAT
jgi:hypothetical protein